MTEHEELDPEQPGQDERTADRARRASPQRPDRDSEKALGLEMARLFGMNPRDLVAPPSRPEPPATPQEEEAAEGASEPAGDVPEGD